MKNFFVSCTLGLGLLAFVASEAQAQTVCLDFTAFCDCMTVSTINDTVGGKNVMRNFGTWENQDCAGTESLLQGATDTSRNYYAGELNGALGLSGYNWNFVWRNEVSVFDIYLWQGSTKTTVQDDTPYCIDAGPCPDDCATLCGGFSGHLPSSTETWRR